MVKVFVQICLFSCMGIGINAQSYFPTLSQWQSFESVASQLPEKFHEKITKKKQIKESMAASPKLTSAKARIVAAISSYGSLFNTPAQKKVMKERGSADGWGRDPRLSQFDADSLFIKIIESGDTVALSSFLEMTQGTSFDINKNFVHGINSNGRFFQYYNEYRQYAPLTLAVACGKPGIIEMLINHGACISQQAINRASSQRNSELAEILVSRAVRLGQPNIAIGVIPTTGAAVDGVVVSTPRFGINEEYVEPSRLAQLSQAQQRSQDVVRPMRRVSPNRSSSGWYIIFLIMLFLPNLSLSFIGKEQARENVFFQ